MADDLAPLSDAAERPLADINIFDPDLLQDPHAYYRRLRQEAPVFRDPKSGIVAVATFDLIMEVNRQPMVFSNNFGGQMRGSIGEFDAEEAAVMADGIGGEHGVGHRDPVSHDRGLFGVKLAD